MPVQFNNEHLKDLVEFTGHLLEGEDRFVCGCLQRNDSYARTKVGGMSDFDNENYYQRIMLRALLPSFPFGVKLEYGEQHFDIALFQSFSEAPVALGEVKLWMGSNENQRLREMRKDIAKLSGNSCSRFLVVFTKNPKADATRNIKGLLNKLGVKEDQPRYSFDTVYPNGRDSFEEHGQFDVIGILLD
jgi:hypothetical protein